MRRRQWWTLTACVALACGGGEFEAVGADGEPDGGQRELVGGTGGSGSAAAGAPGSGGSGASTDAGGVIGAGGAAGGGAGLRVCTSPNDTNDCQDCGFYAVGANTCSAGVSGSCLEGVECDISSGSSGFCGCTTAADCRHDAPCTNGRCGPPCAPEWQAGDVTRQCEVVSTQLSGGWVLFIARRDTAEPPSYGDPPHPWGANWGRCVPSED